MGSGVVSGMQDIEEINSECMSCAISKRELSPV